MRFAGVARILIATIAIAAPHLAAAWDPNDPQGTHLQDIYVPKLMNYDSFFIKSTAAQPISAPNGVLSVAPGPTLFPATVIDANGQQYTLNVKIVKIGTHDNVYGGNDVAAQNEYELVYANGRPLCRNQNNRALAIPGVYSHGRYAPDPDKVSFACIPQKITASGPPMFRGGGIAAKCIDWAYPPWSHFHAPPWVGNTPQNNTITATDDNARRIHQTCLFMGTADYCGNGQPYTVDGTWITMFDLVTAAKGKMVDSLGHNMKGSYHSQPPHPDVDYRFEAAWRPGVISPDAGESGGALCLTKARWATMTQHLLGTAQLPAPCPNLVTAEFCDREPEGKLENNDHALLFSYSLFLDIGLYSCPGPNPLWLTITTDQLTDIIASVHPNDDLYNHTDGSLVFTCKNTEFEGGILRIGAEKAPLPEGFPVDWNRHKPQALYFHRMGPGKYKTDIDSHGGRHIGYILPANVCPGHFCGSPLKLYQFTTGGVTQYVTTAKSPPPPPFGPGGGILLGYLIDLLN